MTAALVAVAFAVAAGQDARAADDPLDAAKSLYLSASYEEALAALGNLPATVDADLADKYRALCLLGLNRPDDAEQALERLAVRRPLLKFDDSESPKLVSMFREARARVLPEAARSMYASAKSRFEKGELKGAEQQFKELMALLSEKELSAQPAFADLKLLAEGFFKLVDQQLAKENAAAAPPPAPAAQPSAAPVRVADDRSRVFSSADTDVRPPIAIDQTIPQWLPPSAELRYQSFSGLLQIVIDESGSVSEAEMAKGVNIVYDQALLAATKRWRYRPAMRNGKAVKYRKVLNIVLKPEGGEGS